MISFRDRFLFALLILATFAFAASAARHSAAYVSMDKKIATLEANATDTLSQPQQTTLTQDELNAYIAEGGVQVPKGLYDIKFALTAGSVQAASKVDFDQLSEGHGGGNPIFSALFSGMHDVEVEAQASGTSGEGTVTIQSAKLDGVTVPKSALQYLIEHYVKPKYPQAGMTSTFQLPARIDSAEVQQGQVVLTQK